VSRGHRWMVVRKTRKIPGGWRVIKQLGEIPQEQAEQIVKSYYKGSARAMNEQELIDIRTAALKELRVTL
jgi:hypothetical protein